MRKPWKLLALLALIFSLGCEGPAPSRPVELPGKSPGSGALNQAGEGKSYRFRWVKCDYGNLPVEIDCGQLTVPVDRLNQQAGKIRLAVTILRSQGSMRGNSTPTADPLLVIAGEPGSAATLDVQYWLENPLLKEHDIILMDLRGTGKSDPSLNCTEIKEPGDANNSKVVSACRQRLEGKSIDLKQYTSAQSAADLNDLQQALGYQKWDVLGVSYGARVALTLLRDYPRGVRSLVLDSVYPPEVNIFEEQAVNEAQAIQDFFTGCHQDPQCQYGYPDLEQVYEALIASLDEDPRQVMVADPHTGEARMITLDGEQMTQLIVQALNSPETLARIPYLIYETHYGNDHAVAGLMFPASGGLAGGSATQDKDKQRAFAEGAFYSVLCAEELPFNNRGAAEAAVRQSGLPLAKRLFNQVESIFEHCQDWKITKAGEIETQPVNSPVPTLLLAGEYDPFTPPRWAEKAAQGLSGSQVLKFPGVGHLVLNLGSCPQDIVAAFLANPDEPLDTTCINDLQVEYWLP
jgi:pimeloyl-ACP methyl ester carboxylesterase